MGVGRLRRGPLALLGGAVLLGCDALAGPDAALPIANLDLEPKRGAVELPIPEAQGPIVEIASGEVAGADFTLTAFPTADGICLWLVPLQFGGGGCGPAPGDGPPEIERFGMISQTGMPNGTFAIDGLVDPEVASVWVVTDDGQRANAELIPLDIGGIETSAFLVFLPEGVHPTAVVAADDSGRVLEELPLISIAPGGPGAPPTSGD